MRAFVDRYDACQHFLGEEPFGKDRRFLEKSTKEVRTGNDKQLRKLRSAYADDAEIAQVLVEFNVGAETDQP